MQYARQRYIYRAFHFIGHRCVEKFMTGFMIDSHTIKRGKLIFYGHLAPLERSNFAYMLGSSGVVKRVLIL